MEDNRLYWSGSKTLYEACKHLTTKGFIAAELYESETKDLRSRIAELEALVLQEQGFKEQAYEVSKSLRADNDRLMLLAYPDGPAGDAGVSAKRYMELEAEVERLHKEIKYNYLYISFLLGQTSKENFKELAKGYAAPLNIEREIDNAKAALRREGNNESDSKSKG